jgi:hypothetical protein
LDAKAVHAVDRLYGGESETIDEVYEAMQREGYSKTLIRDYSEGIREDVRSII